jgi:hypothetical protein
VPQVAVTFTIVEVRQTAVVAQTTTWEEFPRVWRELLDEVYGFVRGRSELATGAGSEQWQNVMLYKDQRPDVEVGVLVSQPFEPRPSGRVRASGGRGGRDGGAPRRLRKAGCHPRRRACTRRRLRA